MHQNVLKETFYTDWSFSTLWTVKMQRSTKSSQVNIKTASHLVSGLIAVLNIAQNIRELVQFHHAQIEYFVVFYVLKF